MLRLAVTRTAWVMAAAIHVISLLEIVNRRHSYNNNKDGNDNKSQSYPHS